MGQRAVFVALRVKRRYTGESRGRFRGFRQVFVAFEAHGNADFGFRWRRIGIGGRPDDPQNASPATNRHALAQSDLRGHAQRELDFGTFREWSVGKEEHSARTQVLSESEALDQGSGLT